MNESLYYYELRFLGDLKGEIIAEALVPDSLALLYKIPLLVYSIVIYNP